MGSTGATSFISQFIINVAKLTQKHDGKKLITVSLIIVGFANGAFKSGLKGKETEEMIKQQNKDYKRRQQLYFSRQTEFEAKVEKMRLLGDDVGPVLTFIKAFPDV